MSTQIQNIAQMRDLRLPAMVHGYDAQLQQPKLHDLPFDDRLGMLLEAEISARTTRKLSRAVKSAGFPEAAALEDLDIRSSRGIEKSFIAGLAGCGWVKRRQNLIILGATGVGKSWLACAFGQQACRLGMSASFQRASDLYANIAEAQVVAGLPKLKASLYKPDVLILDDFGLGDMSALAAQILLDVAERRLRSGSLVITSQYPTDQWHSFFQDPTLADAFLDRVVHQAHRIQLKGESMRKLRGKASLSAE